MPIAPVRTVNNSCYAVRTFPNVLVLEAVQPLKNAGEWQSCISWQPEASRAYAQAIFIQ